MQTKSKLKSKKNSEIVEDKINTSNNSEINQQNSEYVEVGAICNDGTFTSRVGRGAGSYHQGVKHKLYAKKRQI